MRLFPLPLFALLVPAPAPALAQAAAPECAVRVQFGSYAMGIDRPAFERVRALLARDRGVRAVEQQHWGREGETTLCVRTRRPSDARRLFGRVQAALPAKPRGPITVEARGGLRFEAPRPQEH
ncbi:hypothetical protein OMP43_14335 [Sphingomonas sp. CBMAI 2297]|uniref:hypothetical protein n=1 Tax=Sphingomonas sp. CBMAI 2297 TaxID=2991720 RepID=UPI002454187A|nr:hypothetical protein [Sphingomonas sp. CBMAI 2297]MDH4745195.1 hypothetical protein [Sphingomonas sp. CBMAI 2297]